MFEVIVLAIALSMDAFAVSIGLGSKGNTRGLGLKAGLFFGVFQALMPFLGYLGGKGVLGWVDSYASWINGMDAHFLKRHLCARVEFASSLLN